MGNKLRVTAQRPPQPTNGAALLQTSDADRRLVALAIQFTRVSYFTAAERDRLAALLTLITGYRIEGGL